MERFLASRPRGPPWAGGRILPGQRRALSFNEYGDASGIMWDDKKVQMVVSSMGQKREYLCYRVRSVYRKHRSSRKAGLLVASPV